MYTLKKQDINSILSFAKLNRDKSHLTFKSPVLGNFSLSITPLETDGYVGSVVTIETLKDSATFIVDKFTQNINLSDEQYDALTFVINNRFNLES